MHVAGLFNNPLTVPQVAQALGRLGLDTASRVLDVGCGRGEILAMALERFGCRGVGIDSDLAELERARRRLSFAKERVELYGDPVQDIVLSEPQFTAVFCVGATHAFGEGSRAFPRTLQTLSAAVSPGGSLLIGECIWRQPPAPEYLQFTSFTHDGLRFHADNLKIASRFGLMHVQSTLSTVEAWDDYEGRFWSAAEAQYGIPSLAGDGDVRVDHWISWKRAYLRWGRETLGFALYVFRTPVGG